MTTTPERTATLTSLVAAEVRAMLGRLDIRASELARRMGESDQWLSMRLKGRTPIDLNELQRIADALRVPVIDLLPRAVRTGTFGTNGTLPRPTRTDQPGHVRSVSSGPISQPRRDPARPGWAVPPTRRRPLSRRPPVGPTPAAA